MYEYELISITNFIYNEVFECNDETLLNESLTVYTTLTSFYE